MKMNHTRTLFPIAALLFMAGALSLQAANGTWTGATDATWAGANWSAATPGTGDTATFNAASGTVNAHTTINLGGGVTINTVLFNTASAAAYTVGSGSVGSQTLTFNNNGGVTMNSTVANNEVFNAAVVLGTDSTAQSYTNINNSASTLTFAGNIYGGPSAGSGTAGTKTLVMGGSGNTVVGGSLLNGASSVPTTTTIALSKLGAGTLTFNGTVNASTIGSGAGGGAFGTVTINQGTLLIDFSNAGSTPDLINRYSPVSMGGGTLQINGNAANASTQNLDLGTGMTVNPGFNVITVGPNGGNMSDPLPTLNLGAFTQTAGSMTMFTGPSYNDNATGGTTHNNAAKGTITTTTLGLQTKLLWPSGRTAVATVGLYNWASVVTAGSGAQSILAGDQVSGFYTQVTAGGTAVNADANYDLLGNATFNNSKPAYVDTIRFNVPGAFTATTGTGGSGYLFLIGGILVTPNVGAYNTTVASGGEWIGGPLSTAGTSSIDVYQNNTSGELLINAPLYFYSTSARVACYVQGGPGTVVLSGSGTSSANYGSPYLNGGCTVINNNTQIGRAASAMTLYLNGGTLVASGNTALDNSGANVRPVTLLGNGGGLAAYNGTTLTVDGQITSGANTGPLVIGIPASSANGSVAGLLPGTGGTAQGLGANTANVTPVYGNGTVALTYPSGANGNSFYGGVTILGGATLSINSQYGLGGANQGPTIFNSGTLQYATTLATGAAGSALDISAQPVTFAGNATINVNGHAITYANSIGNGGSGSLTLQDTAGGGTLTLQGANNYGGSTTISKGTLQIGVNNSLPTGTTLTLGGSGTVGQLDLNGFNQQVGGLAIGSGATAGSQIIGNSSTTASSVFTFNGSGSTSFGGVIQDVIGSGTKKVGLTVSSGTLSLTAANNYSGGTTLNGGTLGFTTGALGTGGVTFGGGTLQWGASTTTDISSQTVAINSGGATLDVNGNTVTLANAIGNSGTGGLTVQSTAAHGVLNLSSAPTYTGNTTVSGGTLNLNAALASGNVTVANGATFGGTGTVTHNVTWQSGAIVSLTQGSPLTVSGTATLNNNAVLVNAGSPLTTGVYTLFTPTGGFTGGSTVNATPAPGSAIAIGYVGIVSISGSIIQLSVVPAAWSDANHATDDYWSDALNWSGPVPQNAGDTANFNGSGAGNPVILDANKSVGTINFGSAPYVISTSTGKILTLDNSGLGATVTATAGTGTQNQITTPVNLNDNATVAVSGSDALTISGAIANTSAAKTLTVNGAGTTILPNANTYGPASSGSTGTILSGGGTLQVGNNASLGAGDVSVTGSSTLQSGAGGLTIPNKVVVAGSQTATVDNNGNTFTLGGVVSGTTGNLTATGSGTVSLNQVETYGGNTTISAGTLKITGSGQLGSGSYAGNIANSGTLDYNSSASQTLSGIISLGGTVVQDGSGTLTLSVPNTFTGGVNLNGGILNLNATETPGTSGPLGASGTISFGGGTLQYTATDTADYSARFSTAASQAYKIDTGSQSIAFATALTSSGGSLTKLGTGTLTLSAPNTFTGGVNLNAGVLNLNATETPGTSGPLGASGTISFGGGTLQYTATDTADYSARFSMAASQAYKIDTGSQSVTFATGLTSSGGALTKLGTGTLTLSAPNTFAGGVNLNAGILNVDAAVTLGASGTIAFGGGTLQFTSADTTDYSARFSTAASQAYNIDTGGQPVSFATGLTSSGGTLTKTGNGTLTLGGASTYTGATTVSAGTLAVNGSINNGSGSTSSNIINSATMTVNTGATVTTGSSGTSEFVIGNTAGNSILNIAGGTVNANLTYANGITGFAMKLGNVSGANGFIFINGGTLNVNASEMHVGQASGAYGAVDLIGTGAITEGAVLASDAWLAVGVYGNGVLNMTGGMISNNAAYLSLGNQAGGTGVVNISGGLVVDSKGIHVGDRSTGILNVSGSANVNFTGGPIDFGSSSLTTAGTVNLNGGTVTANNFATAGTSTSQLNFNGGTLKAGAVSATFLTGLTSATIYSGGAIIDSTGGNITIGQALLAPAGSGVNGITVATGGSGYLDTPIVTFARGTGDTTGVGASAVAIVSGGQVTGFTITSPGTGYTVAPVVTLTGGGYSVAATSPTATIAANTSGGLTKQGANTLTLTGINTYTGNTVVNAGTLALSGSGVIASPNLSVATNSTFDVTAITPATSYTLGSGTLTMTIDKTGGTRAWGQLAIGSKTLNYAGALTVNKTGTDTLISGDSFTLVSKGGSGWFSSVTLPALGSNLAWDTNTLDATGVLNVYTFTTTPLSLSTTASTAATVPASKVAAHSSGQAAAHATGFTTPANGGTVVINGDNSVTYTPSSAANTAGSDSFNLTVQDGYGSQTLAVSVTVNAANVGPALSPDNGHLTNGGYGSFTASGIPNESYDVEVATSVNGTWVPANNGTVQAAANGVIIYIDTEMISAYGGTVFYRLKQQ
jgi:autotransporter-associated beta strand protein